MSDRSFVRFGGLAGGVGGPLFWLWLGILLWRDPREGPSPQAAAAEPAAARYG